MSTAPADEDVGYQRREQLVRRIFVAILAVFLGAASLGVLGVRTATVETTTGEFELSVRYGRVTRPGLATPWEVEVRSLAGSFDQPIVLETTASYFDLFDENGLDPEPASSSSTLSGEFLAWEFEPPDGDTLSVSFDARIEPAVQWGLVGETRLVMDDEIVASVRYRTTVLP